MTIPMGSLYVVMSTSTVPCGGEVGRGRSWDFHMVAAKRKVSMRLYVSATMRGTAIHHASQFTDSSQRQTT